MTLLLACVFILLHASAVFFLPAFAMQASYVFLVLAPLVAWFAALHRSARDGWRHSRGWLLMAGAMALWTLGMVASLRQDLFLDNGNAAPGDSTLLFILYGVPVMLAVSASNMEGDSPWVRAIDAALAVALGCLFYVHTFSLLTLEGSSTVQQTIAVAIMYDTENAFLLAAAAIRLLASDRRGEHRFYRAVVVFAGLYAVVSFYYNHAVALGDHPDFGSLRDPLIDVPFLAFALEAWRDADAPTRRRPPSATLVRLVRSGSPLLLAIALLAMGIIVLRERFYLGVTLEYTESHKHVPFLEGKSSVGRLGIDIHATAGKGDVGFCNHWTLEISVKQPIRVYAGMPVGQLIYFTTSGDVQVPYNVKGSAKYNDRTTRPVESMMWKNFEQKLFVEMNGRETVTD